MNLKALFLSLALITPWLTIMLTESANGEPVKCQQNFKPNQFAQIKCVINNPGKKPSKLNHSRLLQKEYKTAMQNISNITYKIAHISVQLAINICHEILVLVYTIISLLL